MSVFVPLFVARFAAFPWQIGKIFKQIVYWVVDLLITGIMDAAGFFFRAGVKMFLFYRNPREIAALNWYWKHTLILYVFLVFVSMMMYFVTMMLLADTEDADLQRIVRRLIVSAFLLVISRDLFAVFVAATNQLSLMIYPEHYRFDLAMNTLSMLVEIPSAAFAALLIGLFIGVGLMISSIVLFVVLAMRMLIVYVVYATLPVWLALWVVDVGPAKYGNSVADIMFRGAAVMMLIGVVVSSVIAVGAGVGGSVAGASASTSASVSLPVDVMRDGTIVRAVDGYGVIGADGGVGAASFGDVIIEMWIYLAIMWLVIALMSSMFSMMMSAGSSSPGGTGGFSGYRQAAGAGGGPGTGPGGATYKNSAAGPAHVVQKNERTYVMNDQGAGFWQDPSAGEFEKSRGVFGPDETPEEVQGFVSSAPDNPPTISEKVGHSVDVATGGRYSEAKQSLHETKQDITDTMQESGRIGSFMVSAGNLARRGARSYYSVAKEPTMGESIGELHRVLRESPIGAPNKGAVVSERTPPRGERAEYFTGAHAAAERSSATADTTGSETVDDEMDASADQTQHEDTLSDASGFTQPRGVRGNVSSDTIVRGENQVGATSGFQEATNEEYGRQGVDVGEDPRPYYETRGSVESTTVQESAMAGADDGTTGWTSADVVSADAAGVMSAVTAPDSYETLLSDEFVDTVYERASGRMAASRGWSQEQFKEQALSRAEFKQHVRHQRQAGMSVDEAYASAVETLTNEAAEPMGELAVDSETIEAYGMEDVPDAVSTDGAFRRINLDKADGYDATKAENMWRYDFDDGTQVYVEKGESVADVMGTKVNSEMMNNIAGTQVAGQTHVDTSKGVLRSEGVGGDSLGDVMSGDASVDAEDIDRESFVDAHAASALVGDFDVHEGNVKVMDDGTVRRVNVRESADFPAIVGDQVASQAEEHASELGLDVNEEDVKNRMEEMANEYGSSMGDDVETLQETVSGDVDADVTATAPQEARRGVRERVEDIHENIDVFKSG